MPFQSVFPSVPISSEPAHYDLLKALWRTSIERPSQPILIEVETGVEITALQLYTCSHSVAAFLANRHFARGDVACVVLANCWQYVAFFLGCANVGVTVSGASFLFTDYELERQFIDCQCKLVLTSESNLKRVLSAARKCPKITCIILIDDKNEEGAWGIVRWKTVEETDPFIARPIVQFDVAKDIAMLPYSSGTTGSPKGVMLTHRNLKATQDIFNNYLDTVLMPKLDPNWNWKEQAWLLLLPLYHLYGFHLMLTAIQKGATGVIMTHFDPKRFFHTIEKFRIRMLYVVPPMLVQLAKSPFVKDFNLTSLRFLVNSAAPAGKDLCDEVRRRLPTIEWISQAYGMSEMCLGCFYPVFESKDRPGSSGKLVSNFEAQVVDPVTGIECEPGKLGELWVRSPTVMLGYLNKSGATAETVNEDGWLKSGFLFVCDRLKELIKVRGYQVAPAELEDLLLSHPVVRDCAVIGVPDLKAGELPKAFIVKATDEGLTEQEICDFVAEKMAHYKRLTGGVEFVNEIPKSPSGKILRRLLRDRINNEAPKPPKENKL